MRSSWLRAAVLSGWLGAAAADGVELRMQSDQITLRARNEPLTEILREFARSGVNVKLEPGVERSVTAEFKQADAQKALEQILQPYSHVLMWKVINGPLGALPRLDEIQVFRPGQQARAQPLAAERRLTVVGGTNQVPRHVADEVLLRFKPEARREDVLRMLQKLGGTIVGSLPKLGIYQVRFGPGASAAELAAQLARDPLVAEAELNYVIGRLAPAVFSAGNLAFPPGSIPNVPSGAPAVAVLDSGLSPDAALGNAVRARYDATQPDAPLTDLQGHGTQMALVAAGAVTPYNTTATEGGAPVVAVRVFDSNGMTSNFDIMRSMEFALGQGARVLNLSWGSDTSSDFLASAVAYAQSQNAVVVAAAGNAPTQQPFYPAAYPGVLAVGALTASGQHWEQSNRGAFIDLAAPGVANFPIGYEGPPGAYIGTSIASAYVAHALGLYLGKHPAATAAEAQRALLATLTDAGAPGQDPLYGQGMLDSAALARLLQ